MWITLTGFMGCGKTTVARDMASASSRAIVSLDDLAVQSAGCSVPEFFTRHGEAEYRDLELELLNGLDGDRSLIVDGGGGLVESGSAVDLIRERGVVIWLDEPWDSIRQRLQGAPGMDRPLVERLGWAGLESLYHHRRRLYARAADFRLQGNPASSADLASKALSLCRMWENLPAAGRS